MATNPKDVELPPERTVLQHIRRGMGKLEYVGSGNLSAFLLLGASFVGSLPALNDGVLHYATYAGLLFLLLAPVYCLHAYDRSKADDFRSYISQIRKRKFR